MIRSTSTVQSGLDGQCSEASAAEIDSTTSDYSSSGSSGSDDHDSDYTDSSFEVDIEEALQRSCTTGDKKAGLFLSLDMVQMLRVSTSDGNLAGQALQSVAKSLAPPPRRNSGGACSSRMVFALQTKSAMESHAQHADAESEIPKPKETLKHILMAKGVNCTYHKSDDISAFFTKGSVSEYSLDLMNAVRQHDLDKIRQHHESGHTLQCCNKFGESLIHAIARRGMPEIIRYYINEANCSLRVCCDGGRTPLHDAAWTGNPNFESITILLEDCPDLLLVTDKRGFTPLDFVPKAAHEIWNEFLLNNKDLVIPKGVLQVVSI